MYTHYNNIIMHKPYTVVRHMYILKTLVPNGGNSTYSVALSTFWFSYLSNLQLQFAAMSVVNSVDTE